MAAIFHQYFLHLTVVSAKKMFKEKVNTRTDGRTTDHDISSLAYGQGS